MTFKCLRIISALSLLIATQVIAMPANATSPPNKNGRIAFTITPHQRPHIVTVKANGSQQKTIAHNAHTPLWSPDGRWLIFSKSKPDGTSKLYITQANGAYQRALTRHSHLHQSSPSWSPDGTRIMFVQEKYDTHQQYSAIISIKADGTGERNITGWQPGIRFLSPSWSPSGNSIVYAQHSSKNTSQLIIHTLANNHTRTLTEVSDTFPSMVAWSADGTRILYGDTPTEIYTIRPDGTQRTVISDGDSYHAAWSPNGQQIAFLEDFEGEFISLSHKDGSIQQLPIRKGTHQKIGPPSWSPDGTKLIFALSFVSSHNKNHAGIFTLDISNATLTQLFNQAAEDITWQTHS